MEGYLFTPVAASIVVLIIAFCVNTSLASIATFTAGVMVGVAVGRMSKTRPGHQGKGLFESEGWEGSADVSDWEPFRGVGRSMIDYIANYYRNIESFPVRAQVEPGYLRQRLTQKEFPLEGEKWSNIMADMDNHIMPGITHWQHPRFFAWYPANSSPAAILGDLLASMFNIIGFTWEASPAATELEVIVLDQLGRAIGLPEAFLSGGDGGGVIQGSASEATLVALLAARMRALRHMRHVNPDASDYDHLSKMTLYASDQAHSSVQKASNIAGLGANLRLIPTRGIGKDAENPYALDAAGLISAMKEDVALGRTPIFVSANVGSTNTCAIDPLRSLARCCRSFAEGGPGDSDGSEFVPWLHVDAAYAGSAAVCPEYRWILDGIEGADSFMFNPHKWMLANFDCNAMWVKRSAFLVDALSVTPEILRSKEYQRGQVSDFRDWQVPLGRKFRSLKIWMIMRAFGLNKIRAHIRRHVKLAGDFVKLVKEDDRFEIVAPPRFGLVCFRLKGSDVANQELRSRIISTGFTFLSATKLEGQTCLRLCVGCPSTSARHVRETWEALSRMADAVKAEGDGQAGVQGPDLYPEIKGQNPGTSGFDWCFGGNREGFGCEHRQHASRGVHHHSVGAGHPPAELYQVPKFDQGRRP